MFKHFQLSFNNFPAFHYLQAFVTDFSKYMDLIETTVDLDAVESNEFLIKPEFDDGLKDCKDQMDEIFAKFPKQLSKVSFSL